MKPVDDEPHRAVTVSPPCGALIAGPVRQARPCSGCWKPRSLPPGSARRCERGVVGVCHQVGDARVGRDHGEDAGEQRAGGRGGASRSCRQRSTNSMARRRTAGPAPGRAAAAALEVPRGCPQGGAARAYVSGHVRPDCCLAAVGGTRRAGTVTEQGESAGTAQPPLQPFDRWWGRYEHSFRRPHWRGQRAVSWRRLAVRNWGGTRPTSSRRICASRSIATPG